MAIRYHLDGQEIALSRVRAVVDGQEIYGEVEQLFESRGYETGAKNGRMRAFHTARATGFRLEIHISPHLEGVVGPPDGSTGYRGTGTLLSQS